MGIMKEEELLKWINEQLEVDSYLMLDRDVAALKDLKQIVIDWYQAGENMKEGF